MPEVIEGLASVVEQLTERVQELELRVAALESGKSTVVRASTMRAASPHDLPSSAAAQELPADTKPVIVPVLGKAVLGIAGAYLLRAVAESSSIPRLPVLIFAILYAWFWMIWAARTHVSNRFASGTYAVTSAMILSPLLWESTVRFQVLSPAVTAAVLVGFVLLAAALSWLGRLLVIPWVAMVSAVLTAFGLMLSTHDSVPWIAALLTMALVAEVAATIGRRSWVRVVPAIAADLALGLMLFFMMAPDATAQELSPATPATLMALFACVAVIFGAPIFVRSFGLLHQLGVFDIIQCALAFLLSGVGFLRVGHGTALAMLGVAYVALAAVCYWGALSRFAPEAYARNRRISAYWAAGLLLAGSLLLLPAAVEICFLCMCALIAAYLYTRTAKFSLGLHATFYLAAAAALSELPAYIFSALAGSVPSATAWNVWVIAAAAPLCYMIGSRRPEAKRGRRTLWAIPALLTAFTVAALAVTGLVSTSAGVTQVAASRLAVLRTIVGCLLALGLGVLGSRWKRVELVWVAYTAVGFGTIKLLFEDLRFGSAGSLVVSLLFYGCVLIFLPRLTRSPQNTTALDSN
jgi:hypothetical protein